jgi:hypothetical protein
LLTSFQGTSRIARDIASPRCQYTPALPSQPSLAYGFPVVDL